VISPLRKPFNGKDLVFKLSKMGLIRCGKIVAPDGVATTSTSPENVLVFKGSVQADRIP
jgi:hypothetical protein